MKFHFLASSSLVKSARPLSFIFVLVPAFFERYLSIVRGRHGENLRSRSNFLCLKADVHALPGLGFRREFVPEKPFWHCSRKKS
jgi:hypothetical protein